MPLEKSRPMSADTFAKLYIPAVLQASVAEARSSNDPTSRTSLFPNPGEIVPHYIHRYTNY